MYKIKNAENNDVDLLLDMKLDIIFNSEEILELNKNEMEKIVNYSEEEIRANLSEYKLVSEDETIVATYAVVEYNDGKLIDTIYVKPYYRNKGIGTKILNRIIKENYQPIYLWVYRSNKKAIDLYEKLGFIIQDETENKFFMINKNIKRENDRIKAKLFCKDVEQLSKKYNLEYFFVTEGASKCNVKNCNEIKIMQKNYINSENESSNDILKYDEGVLN